MNIAITFSGMCRSFKTTYPGFVKNIVTPLKNDGHAVDIFMHIWDNEYRYVKFMKDEGTVDEVISLYKPTSFKIEKYDKHTINRLANETDIVSYLDYIVSKNYIPRDNDERDFVGGGPQRNNRISMFYGMSQLKNLILKHEEKTGVTYDCIIKNRLDNMIFSPINTTILSDLENTVYSSMGYEANSKAVDFTINDMFLVGDRDSMLKHFNVYKNLVELLTIRFDKNHPKPFQAVGLVKHNLIHEGVGNIKRFYLDHIVTRRLHKYEKLNSVVTGDGWDVPIKKTTEIVTENNRWI